jgi:site-specific DNA-methyltransferase (adenine-specific)
MKIINKNLKDVKPYENNPRKNDKAVDLVAESIKEFGFKVPVVIDKNNVIVSGHTRYKAAKKLGLDTIPCVVADDLTDQQIKAFRIADNKVAEGSQWDFILLTDELHDIDDLFTGFNDDEIQSLFKEPEALDLEDKPIGEKEDIKVYHCPKCGFEFEV